MNFESIIKEAQKAGLSIDDIAKQFTDTLNKVQSTSNREYILNSYLEEFQLAENYTDLDPAHIYALIAAEDNPEWTADDIKAYVEFMDKGSKYYTRLIGKDFNEVLSTLESELDKTLENLEAAFKKPSCSCRKQKEDSPKKKDTTESDTKILNDFMKIFNLL